MWYKKSFRRHLSDMHIEDWNDEFLSEFSPEQYYACLKKANIQSAMLYFQSHVGYCYYPTKSGHMHKAFVGREDAMKRLAEMCRQGGIDVVGYYSLIFNNWAYDEHPNWRMVDIKKQSPRELGEKRYGTCCPNNAEYRAFVMEQIKEISEYFTFDGMFYDMPFWPFHCYCESCKARWEKECGKGLPSVETDARWNLFEQKRKEWMGDFSQLVTAETKRLNPDVSVSQNYAFAALPVIRGIDHRVNEACDYASGDLYVSLFTKSFACKLYAAVSRDMPFELMSSRCEPSLSSHTITKTKDKLTVPVMLACAHHGASMIIDAIDPVGTLNPKVYDLIGEVFDIERQYEPFLTGMPISDVGIYYSLDGKTNRQGQPFTNYSGSVNTVKTMINNHIPMKIYTWENREDIFECPFLILSNPNNLPPELTQLLIDYVERGGALYFSNTDEKHLFETLTGGTACGYTKETRTYMAPKSEWEALLGGYTQKYPLPFNYSLPITSGIDPASVVATVTLPYTVPDDVKFASIHSNPPGISTDMPALLIRAFGKGTVIWSAAPIEHENLLDYTKIIVNLFDRYSGKKRTLRTTAPKNIELVAFDCEQENAVRISAVDLSDEDTSVTWPPFKIDFCTDKPVKSVVLLPKNEEIPFFEKDGYICFNTKPLRIFDMYQINFKECYTNIRLKP